MSITLSNVISRPDRQVQKHQQYEDKFPMDQRSSENAFGRLRNLISSVVLLFVASSEGANTLARSPVHSPASKAEKYRKRTKEFAERGSLHKEHRDSHPWDWG